MRATRLAFAASTAIVLRTRNARPPAAAMSAAAASPGRAKKQPVVAPTSADRARMAVKGAHIAAALARVYPVAPTGFLHHRNTFTLLVAVLMSAQTTDAKVNSVTPALFDAADNPADMAALGQPAVLAMIKSVGLSPGKSKNIIGMSQMLVEKHDGIVPETFEELELLPGVGHKTASVVMMQAFGRAAFPVGMLLTQDESCQNFYALRLVSTCSTVQWIARARAVTLVLTHTCPTSMLTYVSLSFLGAFKTLISTDLPAAGGVATPNQWSGEFANVADDAMIVDFTYIVVLLPRVTIRSNSHSRSFFCPCLVGHWCGDVN
jgi:HhH-GPD superfamily base excision DNA repair protein